MDSVNLKSMDFSPSFSFAQILYGDSHKAKANNSCKWIDKNLYPGYEGD